MIFEVTNKTGEVVGKVKIREETDGDGIDLEVLENETEKSDDELKYATEIMLQKSEEVTIQ